MDLLKGVLGGAKSGKGKKDEDPKRRRRDYDCDHITHISIPKYRMGVSHVDYVIEVQKAGTTWQVSRRYQQFKKLHADLASLCPMTTPYHCDLGVIPVLCGSSWTEVTNHSIELIEKRRRFLEIYLEQLVVPKNRFYQARTPLYSFLHDDETPVNAKPGTIPLPGLGAAGGPATERSTSLSSTQPSRPTSPEDESLKSVDVSATRSSRVPIPAPKAGVLCMHSSSTSKSPGFSASISKSPGYCASVPVPSYLNIINTSEPGTSPSEIDTLPHPAEKEKSLYERCTKCGRIEVVDYPIGNWDEVGPCDTCLKYRQWELCMLIDGQLTTVSSKEAANFRSIAQREAAAKEGKPAEAKKEGSVTLSPSPETFTTDLRSRTTTVEQRPEWKKDANVTHCELCSEKFSFFLRKHHCRKCGGVFCGYCSSFTAHLTDLGYTGEVRVCRGCKESLAAKNSRSPTPASPNSAATEGSKVATGSTPPSPPPATSDPKPDPPPEFEAAVDSDSNKQPMSDTERETCSPPPRDEPLALPDCVRPKTRLQDMLESIDRDLRVDDFELITTLGKGTFGKVMKVLHRSTAEVYAMKVLSKKVVHKRRMVEYIREEKDILSSLNHPFIVPLYAAFQTTSHLYLILEFLPGGEMYSHIYSQGQFGEADARFYISEIILAIEYLHDRDIVHRDIKPENIVLDREGHAVLTDFGLAKAQFSRRTRRSFVGSAEYLAPETVRGEAQTKAVDWWSTGVLLYEMLVGSAPFNGTNNNDVYNQILHKELDYTNIRSISAQSLLRALLTKSPSKRLSDGRTIRRHPFFDVIAWDLMLQRKLKPPFVPDLQHNDTKYFSREFTHEWAVIDGEPPAGRSTLELLSSKFNNFPVAATGDRSPRMSPPSELPIGNLGELFSVAELERGTPGDHPAILVPRPLSERQQLYDQLLNSFYGSWTLRTLELVAVDGKVSYPWGPDVIGLLIYTMHGFFSMQLACSPRQRGKFRDPDYKKVTRDEMANAYLGYVASFGWFQYEERKNYILHHCTSSLCPNWSDTVQKRYFSFNEDNDVLILTTSPVGVEGVEARTVMRFERIKEIHKDHRVPPKVPTSLPPSYQDPNGLSGSTPPPTELDS